jgi:hypothetical protein
LPPELLMVCARVVCYQPDARRANSAGACDLDWYPSQRNKIYISMQSAGGPKRADAGLHFCALA